ncbi:class I SAM-dependent methyltransferase [Pseudomonadales bacterium]|nr:class I SAM-dependent methyltransferase [Pseudomonadales bacterium]
MNTAFPEQFFQRQDESADENFYSQPRFVTHIDDATISSLTEFYGQQIAPGSRVLDLMSSWISHLPEGVDYAHVSGLGMNTAELEANPRLNHYCVQDLNITPTLPFADNSFDAVLIAVSIQYLVKPVDVMTEINRCLTTGGQCIVAMSHRLFPTKAIHAFHVLPPADRCRLVATYMEKSGLTGIEALDHSPQTGDPLWIVRGYCS